MSSPDLFEKTRHLRRLIRAVGSAAVAYSGGVDSTLLLAVCQEALGTENVLALTVDSLLNPSDERERGVELAARFAANHRVVRLRLLETPEIAANPPDRCYHCKRTIFRHLLDIQKAEELNTLLRGANADDRTDYRPGMQAAEELGVRAPLLEAGLTKTDIRILSRDMGLPTWNLPSMACLASRFPYGTRLTAEGLKRVDTAESTLRRRFGLRQLRVREHFPIARIEIPEEDIVRLSQSDVRAQVVRQLRKLGYRYVALDLEGFRSGSMNAALVEERQGSACGTVRGASAGYAADGG